MQWWHTLVHTLQVPNKMGYCNDRLEAGPQASRLTYGRMKLALNFYHARKKRRNDSSSSSSSNVRSAGAATARDNAFAPFSFASQRAVASNRTLRSSNPQLPSVAAHQHQPVM